MDMAHFRASGYGEGEVGMSYEGFQEYLCPKGHYNVRDAYSDDCEACPDCGEPITYYHPVDQTNGEDPNNPACCVAEVEPIGAEDTWHEDMYGNRYATQETLYKPAPGSAWMAVDNGANAK